MEPTRRRFSDRPNDPDLLQPLEPGIPEELQQRMADAAEAAELSPKGRERTFQAEVENEIAEESGEFPPNSINYEDIQ